MSFENIIWYFIGIVVISFILGGSTVGMLDFKHSIWSNILKNDNEFNKAIKPYRKILFRVNTFAIFCSLCVIFFLYLVARRAI